MTRFQCVHDTKQGLRSKRHMLLLACGDPASKQSIKLRSGVYTEMPHAKPVADDKHEGEAPYDFCTRQLKATEHLYTSIAGQTIVALQRSLVHTDQTNKLETFSS